MLILNTFLRRRRILIMAKNNYKSLLELIGHTPLARLDMETIPTLLAKCEFLSMGGSIKDRTALHLIETAEKSGKLKPGGTIVEASSGNQGIALALIGSLKGYRVIITVPDRTAAEKVAILRAYGAEVYVCPNTDSHDDPRGYHAMAESLLHSIPGAYMPDQYYNKENAMAHYLSTGPDLWSQTQGEITHFICGAGTCGTISGTGRYLKEKNPNVRIIGVDSVNSFYSNKEPKAYQVEGIGIDVISDVFDQKVVDEIITVTDEQAFSMTRQLANKNGLLVGISSGAVMHVALEYCKNLKPSDVVVVMLADSGKNYLSKVFMNTQEQRKNTQVTQI
jgi:cystathionine beta-synthase